MVQQVSGKEPSLKTAIMYIVIIVAFCAFLVWFMPWFSLLLIKAFGYLTAFVVLLIMAMIMVYILMLFYWLGACHRISLNLVFLIVPISGVMGIACAWYSNEVLEILLNIKMGFNAIGNAIIAFITFQFVVTQLLARKYCVS
ncbi:MAG: hypothetical protein QXT53_04770 [Ignisphaera sp.]